MHTPVIIHSQEPVVTYLSTEKGDENNKKLSTLYQAAISCCEAEGWNGLKTLFFIRNAFTAIGDICKEGPQEVRYLGSFYFFSLIANTRVRESIFSEDISEDLVKRFCLMIKNKAEAMKNCETHTLNHLFYVYNTVLCDRILVLYNPEIFG